MNQDIKITYTYQNKETGNRLQRTFSIAEIKAGEDDAHLALIPGYELIGAEGADFAELMTETAIALKEWHAEEVKKLPVSAEAKEFVGKWAFRIFRIVSGTHGQPFHFRMWDVIKELGGWRKVVCEITSDLYMWSMEK
jgi:hypothetical protein